MTLSVIGCVVNGPGEATMTDIGLTGGGRGTHQIYINGLSDHRLQDADVVDHLVELVEKKAAEIEAAEKESAALADPHPDQAEATAAE
jgi:(E)-4-hydroxy-3-methylbut-2-enyl-diphosphate synthase